MHCNSFMQLVFLSPFLTVATSSVGTAIPVVEEVCSSQTEQGMFVVGTVHANLYQNHGACVTLYFSFEQ